MFCDLTPVQMDTELRSATVPGNSHDKRGFALLNGRHGFMLVAMKGSNPRRKKLLEMHEVLSQDWFYNQFCSCFTV